MVIKSLQRMRIYLGAPPNGRGRAAETWRRTAQKERPSMTNESSDPVDTGGPT